MGFGYFAVIPYPVLSSKNIDGNEKVLYALISARLEIPGFSIISNKELSTFFGVDTRTVSNWVSNLEKNGFIRVVQNKHKHRRQIYLKEFAAPSGEEDPSKFSEKQKQFMEAFPERVMDMGEIPDFVDMQLLIKFVKSSNWLNEHKELSLSWLVNRYKTILAGGYKDYERKKKPSTERNYTREEMNSFFQKIDEVEI